MSETTAEASETVRKRVLRSREAQIKRFQGEKKIYANAQMPSKLIRKHCAISTEGEKLLETGIKRLGLSASVLPSVDTDRSQSNNPVMAHPESVRRVKSYSAASGFVYQYQFQDAHPSNRDSTPGNEYVYYVSADRKTMFPICIFVRRDAVDRWSKQTNRILTGTEEYAAAKMRLFQALDEVEDFAVSRPELTVDDSNLTQLLERLDL